MERDTPPISGRLWRGSDVTRLTKNFFFFFIPAHHLSLTHYFPPAPLPFLRAAVLEGFVSLTFFFVTALFLRNWLRGLDSVLFFVVF